MVKTIYLCDRCKTLIDLPLTVTFQSGEPEEVFGTATLDLCESCAPVVYSFAAEALLNEEPSMPPEDAPVADEPKEGEQKKRIRIDTGKIKALKAAGWSVKEIAAEMKLKTSQVSNALYLAKKKQEETENER